MSRLLKIAFLTLSVLAAVGLATTSTVYAKHGADDPAPVCVPDEGVGLAIDC